MAPTVSTAEHATLSEISEMSFKFAGERDPELLLQGLCHMSAKTMDAQHASIGILEDDGMTISRVVFSDQSATSAVPHISVLQSGLLANMLGELKTLRLPNGTSESLAVPLCGSLRIRGWLFLTKKIDGIEFSEQDEHKAVALAVQVTLAYERIEEHRRVDEELGESKEVLEAIFEGAPDAIVAVDEQGKIVKINAQTQALFGYTRDELIGQPVEILVPERFRAAHLVHRRQYSSCPHLRLVGEGLELFGRRKDASEFSADIALSPLDTKRGKLMLSLIRDATARKQNVERIRGLNQSLEKHVGELQTANEELESFSYSVSHDLRAPLRQVDGFARVLRERIGPQADADTSHYLQRIQDAAKHMADLLEGLLDMGRLGRQGLRLRSVDLNSLASEVVEELKLETPDGRIEWILEPLPVTLCDGVLVKAVFSNLLSNAVKFTGSRERPVIRVGCQLENGEAVIFVTDNGVGFDMKYADKLFGIFQRLHRSKDFPGTGMGLATVQRIVKKHGGRIWADAELNSSATFRFTLLPGADNLDKVKHEIEALHAA